jgi:sugar phosphate isomerase/epimerase
LTPIALQLYTVREEATRDFPGALRRVAQIGYRGVELAGLHGHKPSEVAAMIRDLGLELSSSHTDLPAPENIERILDTELTLGSKRIVHCFGPDQVRTVDLSRQAAEMSTRAAALLKPHGLSLGLHNHWWEMAPLDGKCAFDILLDEAPDIFGQLDVYWAAYAGADPVSVLTRHRSRIPLLHIKDGTLEKDAPQTAVGDGALDMPAIIRAADSEVLEWLIVELDECATDMFEAVERSYNYLTSTGLALGNK